MSKVKKYIVTQNNTIGSSIGDVIELTEKQANFLVNKVELAPVVETKTKKTKKPVFQIVQMSDLEL